MFDFFTPTNWFWILVAILLSCYVKLAAGNGTKVPAPSFSPAAIVSIFRGGV